MAYSTALDGLGVLSLGEVQVFFKKMKLDLAKVIIKKDYFVIYDPQRPRTYDYQRFYDFFNDSKLCPVIGAFNKWSKVNHSMVLDQVIQHDNEWYLQCKNTYESNAKAFVGHNFQWGEKLNELIEFRPIDAFIILFDYEF